MRTRDRILRASVALVLASAGACSYKGDPRVAAITSGAHAPEPPATGAPGPSTPSRPPRENRPMPTPTPTHPPAWCLRHDETPCTAEQLADPKKYRQVLLFPGGYTDEDYDLWKATVVKYIRSVTDVDAKVYSSRYKEQLLYRTYWIPGDKLGGYFSTFGAKVFAHPIRGKALTLRQDEVVSRIESIQKADPDLKPWVVMVVFNTHEPDITANAAPPNFLGQPYGIGKVTAEDLEGHYTAMHEMAHAGLNYLDEYIEGGFGDQDITSLDALAPLILMDGSWAGWTAAIDNLFGVYTIRISETLAGLGNDNIDVTMYPSRVATPGYVSNAYENEGGMFFGKGTFHDRIPNIMGSDDGVTDTVNDGFGYDQSFSQSTVIRQAFVRDVPRRPNDRLRNAGPIGTWAVKFGDTSRVMMYDGDKHHHYHPTATYDVQVGWDERDWKTCWEGPIPYPCYDEIWTVVEKEVTPEKRTVQLKASAAFGLAGMVQGVLCGLGFDTFATGGGEFNLCVLTLEQMSNAFLPTLVFTLPYQETVVPASQWMTTYKWRFRTHNGLYTSGWTGWTSFFRAL